jgi:hypothetical protein
LIVQRIIGQVAELLVLVLVGLERQRQSERLVRGCFAGTDLQRGIRRELRCFDRRRAQMADPRFSIAGRGVSYRHLGTLLAFHDHSFGGQFGRPRLSRELQGQLNGARAAGVVVDSKRGFPRFARTGIDRPRIRGQQPTVLQQREISRWLGRPARQVRVQIVAVPTRHAVDLNRGLADRERKSPRLPIARHLGADRVGSGAVGADGDFSKRLSQPIEQFDFLRRRGKSRNVDCERTPARNKAHVHGPLGTGQHDRLLVPLVFVPARRFDQIPRAVRRKAPNHLVAVAVLGHGDVQGVNARSLDLRRDPRLLDRSPVAAARLAVVRNRCFLNHSPIRPDQNGAQHGRTASPVPIPLVHLDRQFARLGQQIHAPDAAQAWLRGPVRPRFGVYVRCVHGRPRDGQRNAESNRSDNGVRHYFILFGSGAFTRTSVAG